MRHKVITATHGYPVNRYTRRNAERFLNFGIYYISAYVLRVEDMYERNAFSNKYLPTYIKI